VQQPNPALWDEPGIRAHLAVRDIANVFRLLRGQGFTHRQLAELAGMSQSQVSEIMSGRQVQAYDVLVRICQGLGVPRAYMGLAYDEDSTPAPPEEVDEEVKRRVLMATASIALFGSPVLGELLHIPVRPSTPTPLPSRLAASDVAAIKSLTESLRTVTRTYGGWAETVTAVAHRSLRLMSVPASEQVEAEMTSALANLHTMAGWTCVDSGLHDQARACFAKAMELAGAAKNSHEMASAFRHAGIQMCDAGAYDDGLKAFQLGLMGAEDGESIAWLHGETALPYARMGQRDQALTALKKFRERPLSDPFDAADMDYVASCAYGELGQLDRAEALAAASVRKWEAENVSRRDRVEADIALAKLHAIAGEPDTIQLTRKAIAAVAELQSVRARLKLIALAQALETRPRADFRELAVHARRVAGTMGPGSIQV
jgi:transcriptional regulator with XRE-family HTH domain